MEARLQVAAKAEDPALRSRLLDEAAEDAALVEHWRGPEALVRFAHGLSAVDTDRARQVFQRALESSESSSSAPQFRSLQMTGVAAAVASFDREWAARIFDGAIAAAQEDEERVKRVTALAVIANEMAESHPQEAPRVFQRAMEEARGLEAVWEYAHVLDIVFRQDRSPYLDVSAARPLVEHVVERLSDEDPRVPGVFGLPEAARLMLQVDPERGVEVLHRWLAASEAAGDSDGMTQAALLMSHADPQAARDALIRAREYVSLRVDCMAIGDFSRAAASAAPELTLELAPQIQDPGQRAAAVSAAVVSLYEREPDRALEVLRSLERPVDRSSTLLHIADRLLGTGDRPQPQPLLDEML
jgi:hypothetical protein